MVSGYNKLKYKLTESRLSMTLINQIFWGPLLIICLYSTNKLTVGKEKDITVMYKQCVESEPGFPLQNLILRLEAATVCCAWRPHSS